MTKEELIEMINDDAVRENLYDLTENMAVCLFGSEEEAKKVYDSKTKKYKTEWHEVTLMEVLVSIKDALWTIADNM